MCEKLKTLASSCPDRVCHAVAGRGSLSYSQWEARSARLALGLLRLRLRSGDPIVLVFPNEAWLDLVVAFVGVQMAGGVPIVLSNHAGTAEIEVVIDECDAKVVVCRPQERFQQALVPSATPHELEHAAEDAVTLPPPPGWNDVAGIVYTSGTTGVPKAIAYSYMNTATTVALHSRGMFEHDEGSVLNTYPVSAAVSHSMFITPIVRGLPVVVLPEFEPGRVAACIEEYRIAEICVAPAGGRALLASGALSSRDTSSVRHLLVSSASAPPALLRDLSRAFPGAEVLTGYSTSESLPASTEIVYEPSRPTSVGRPCGGSLVKVVDENGAPVPHREVGEVMLSYPGVPTRQYYRDSASTAEVFQDGWVRTGDAGYLDEEGYLFLVDRIKDVVNIGGRKVSTIEVEAALHEHPMVVDVAVFGIKDQSLGEELVAAVVLKLPVPAQQLREFLGARLAKHKIPWQIAFVQSLPRNPAGKVVKSMLRDRVAHSQRARRETLAGATVEDRTLEIAREVLGVRLGANEDLFALGADSLSCMRIAARINESFGIALSLAALWKFPTVEALAREVSRESEAPAVREGVGEVWWT